jgi:flagellar biosynthetic protein FlhB
LSARPGAGCPPGFDLQRFAGERTLPATQRRRQQARERGQVARSGELAGAAGFLAAAVALRVLAPAPARTFALWAKGLWGGLRPRGLGAGAAGALLLRAGHLGAALLLPVAGLAALVAIVAGVAQTGFSFSTAGITPDFTRLDPLRGLQRLFSRQALFELLKSALKWVAVAGVAYGPCRAMVERAVADGLGAVAAAGLLWRTVETVLLRTGLVLLVAGVADFAFQRYTTDQSLLMTLQEVRDETRVNEGDPALRARRRRRARELARRRMLGDVRRADVVLANPTHYAVALRYAPEQMAAPVVVAKGVDHLALRIRALAAVAGVPVVENAPLARSLYGGVAVGAAIPAALYQAVAEVLAFVWRVRGRA